MVDLVQHLILLGLLRLLLELVEDMQAVAAEVDMFLEAQVPQAQQHMAVEMVE
jgi:hypothetical protein